MRILITGATGFVGRSLVAKLKSKHQIIVLTRNTLNAKQVLGNDVEAIQWDSYHHHADLSVAAPIDAVINLVGENLAAKRWSNEQKKLIYNSRVEATQTLINMLIEANQKPKVFLSTSATGYYGHRDGKIQLDEKSLPGNDFLSKVCDDWEKVVVNSQKYFDRFAILRVGMVIGKNGGAIEKMLPLFKWGLAGKLGSGDQYISWIHLEDLVNMYIYLLEHEEQMGVFNAVANFALSNNDFTKKFAKIMRKKPFLPAPKLALELVLGEMSHVVLTGANVTPKKFNDLRFHYRFPTIDLALKDVVSIA
jgi:uncharacterized protein